jgi:hypothetical protein
MNQYDWCNPCESSSFASKFQEWTSENHDLDIIIQNSQLNAQNPGDFIEWIPYDQFQNIAFVASGGFSTIHSATWLEPILEFGGIYGGSRRSKVALKRLENSQHLSTEFLNKLRQHQRCRQSRSLVETTASLRTTADAIYSSCLFVKTAVCITFSTKKLDINPGHLSSSCFCGSADGPLSEFHGVLPYVAPEVLRGDDCTMASDIYSFGVIMW